MSDSTWIDSLFEGFYARTGQPRSDSVKDAAFKYQRTYLRELVGRLDMIMEHAEIPLGQRHKVLHAMVFGCMPWECDADLRQDLVDFNAERLKYQPWGTWGLADPSPGTGPTPP